MGHRILIADDEPNIVLSLEFLMQRAGFDVSIARTGDEAFAHIAAARPDLVLLDVMLPGMTGFEVCERVRADPSLAATRIIMLTAKGREVEVNRGLALGADAYVTKPFSTQELVGRVRELLGLAGAG
jgi:DNA-binding response OmpR family regulator